MHRWLLPLAILLALAGSGRAADRDHPGGSVERTVAVAFIAHCAGYAEFVSPLLKKHGFGATFYIDDASMTNPGSRLSPRPLMSWAQVKDLSHLGFEIGNATADIRDSI